MKFISAIACAAALCVAAPAFAQTQPNPGGEEIWDISATGTPRHWHTGLTCWDEAGGTPFVRRIAYNPTGSDVSCSYGDSNMLMTLYVTQRPGDHPAAALIAEGRRQFTERYRGARMTSDTQRTIQTSAGAIQIDELVFAIEGEDVTQNQTMRGSSGIWQTDVGGWILKLRLSNYRPGSAGDLSPLAATLLGRAYAEMQTALACATAGREQAPNLNLIGQESVQVQVSAAVMMPQIVSAMPDTPLEARRAGFVCLGDSRAFQDGLTVVGVFPAQRAAAAATAPTDVTILGLAEIRPANAAPTMVAQVDMSMNPFGVPDVRNDRGHFLFSTNGETSNFYGVLNGGELRQTLAWFALRIQDGATPIVTSSPRQD